MEGLTNDDNYFVSNSSGVLCIFPAEGDMRVLDLMKGPEKPTCVLCPDDYSCFGAMWLLREAGIQVPGDISLIGFDGIRITQMISPRLTTYRQNTESISKEAIALLTEAIEEPETHIPRQITVQGRLVEGETVGEA